MSKKFTVRVNVATFGPDKQQNILDEMELAGFGGPITTTPNIWRWKCEVEPGDEKNVKADLDRIIGKKNYTLS